MDTFKFSVRTKTVVQILIMSGVWAGRVQKSMAEILLLSARNGVRHAIPGRIRTQVRPLLWQCRKVNYQHIRILNTATCRLLCGQQRLFWVKGERVLQVDCRDVSPSAKIWSSCNMSGKMNMKNCTSSQSTTTPVDNQGYTTK
jgi:hypothetical protein